MTEQELSVLRRVLRVWWPEGEQIDPALGLEDYMAFKFRLVLESEAGVPRLLAERQGWDMTNKIVRTASVDDLILGWKSLAQLRELAVAYLERADEETSETETPE